MIVDCYYNTACQCEEKEKNGYLIRDCEKCGWNPEVAKRRKAQMLADQFLKDARTQTRRFFVVGAKVNVNGAKPMTMVLQKSPQGNFCVKIGEETLVIPGSTAKEVVNGR